MLTGVTYINPIRNIPEAVPAEIIQDAIDGKASLMTVLRQFCKATKLPTPNTNNMKKNRMAKS